MHKIPMTQQGKQTLVDYLTELKKIERPKISAAIASARELGDLKENAEYHAAREKQGITEAMIRDIEDKINRSQVIDISKIENNGKVIFGSFVEITNLDNNKSLHYQIVGEDEADINQNKLSITSPLARAIIGKYEGDHVDVSTPNGITPYSIVKVDYLK